MLFLLYKIFHKLKIYVVWFMCEGKCMGSYCGPHLAGKLKTFGVSRRQRSNSQYISTVYAGAVCYGKPEITSHPYPGDTGEI